MLKDHSKHPLIVVASTPGLGRSSVLDHSGKELQVWQDADQSTNDPPPRLRVDIVITFGYTTDTAMGASEDTDMEIELSALILYCAFFQREATGVRTFAFVNFIRVFKRDPTIKSILASSTTTGALFHSSLRAICLYQRRLRQINDSQVTMINLCIDRFTPLIDETATTPERRCRRSGFSVRACCIPETISLFAPWWERC